MPSWPLQEGGPAQWDWLIHFCGRPQWADPTPYVPNEIRALSSSAKLDRILWDQRLLGFPPFGAQRDQPMLSLSECPPDHLRWLLSSRGWQPWGLMFRRQVIYDLGGGPAWSVRSPQFNALAPEQRPWAVRLDTDPQRRSDWLFEREWRLPLAATDPALRLSTAHLSAILIGAESWTPSIREEATGLFRSDATGELVDPGDPHARPVMRTVWPALWMEGVLRIAWNPTSSTFSRVET